MVDQIKSVDELNQQPDYKKALVSLLYQVADDNFIISYRGSEWLALAPHLEADVAFSSIWQDHMGHASLFYNLLEQIGEGKADDLAHLRKPEQMKNAILTERANGEGDYIAQPRYDWAYAVVRQCFYDLYESVRMDALKQSSYVPLAQAAAKIAREKPYHVLHGEMWLKQMTETAEAKTRLQKAMKMVWEDLSGLFSLGEEADALHRFGIIESEEMLRQRFMDRAKTLLDKLHIAWPGEPAPVSLDGRNGEHTADLQSALDILSEVYQQDPAANW